MTLGELFSHNYKELHAVARRITRRRDINLAPALMNETFIDVHHETKYPGQSDEFVKWFSRAMRLRFISQRSAFQKNHASCGQSLELDAEIPDHESHTGMELAPEDASPATKELIEVSSSMKKERVLKYLKVLEFRKSLPLHEQYLFDLYYSNQLSTRAISDQLSKETGFDMNYQRINIMVNSIKAKIKAHQWQQ
jgi:RNA polymerase sigma factor (sigma-70 family)